MRVVILGFGAMGRRHAEALQQVPGARLVGIADRSAERLEAGEGVEMRDTDAARLLGTAHADLVIVATHAPSHHDLVLAAMESGATRVLCEKPISTSSAEATRMIQGAARHGVRLAVNHCRRHVPAYRDLAQRAASGAWGPLRSASAWCPGIGLACRGTHYLDLLRFVTGEELVSVAGWIDPERGPNPRGREFHDPGGLLLGHGRSGARIVLDQVEDGSGPGTLDFSFAAAHVAVDEGAGTIRIVERTPEGRLRGVQEQRDVRIDVVGLTTQVLRELAGEGPLTCAAEHGQRAVEAVIAAHLSHEAGHRPVAVPLEGDHATRRLPIT